MVVTPRSGLYTSSNLRPLDMRSNWSMVIVRRGSSGLFHSGTGAGRRMSIIPFCTMIPRTALVTLLAMDQPEERQVFMKTRGVAFRCQASVVNHYHRPGLLFPVGIRLRKVTVQGLAQLFIVPRRRPGFFRTPFPVGPGLIFREAPGSKGGQGLSSKFILGGADHQGAAAALAEDRPGSNRADALAVTAFWL